MFANSSPVGGPQDENRETPTCKVLLVAQVLVSRDDEIETVCLCRRKQFAVPKLVPAKPERCVDVVTRERMAKRAGRGLR
jgi:hypothetical protein